MANATGIRNSELKYSDIPDGELLSFYDHFENLFVEFLEELKYPSDTKYSIDSYALIDAIVRVDKRKAYFWCFHNMEINERKEVALYAYWFLKFKPFSICDNRFADRKQTSYINELFAIYLISSILLFDEDEFAEIGVSNSKDKFTYLDKLLYSLRYRCFTIDSFMILIDSITPETLEYEFAVKT